jgi:DNA-binding MarR family transcriptional regulator
MTTTTATLFPADLPKTAKFHHTTTSFLLLAVLHVRGPIDLQDVCELLFISVPTAQILLWRLERNRLIFPDPHSKFPRYSITDHGRLLVSPYVTAPTA